MAHELAHQWFGQARGLEELSRAVAERRLRAVLRRALREREARRRRVPRHPAPVPPLGDRRFRPGPGVSRLSPRAHQGREPRLPRAGLQQGRRRAAHAAPADRRRSVLPRPASGSTPTTGSRRRAPTICARRWKRTAAATSTRFFERWIYDNGIPRLRYSTAVEGQELVVRFEQAGEVYDVPVTVTRDLHRREDRPSSSWSVNRGDHRERRFPLTGTVRSVEANQDGAAVAVIERGSSDPEVSRRNASLAPAEPATGPREIQFSSLWKTSR